jgi:hypothetical protein
MVKKEEFKGNIVGIQKVIQLIQFMSAQNRFLNK